MTQCLQVAGAGHGNKQTEVSRYSINAPGMLLKIIDSRTGNEF